jgi:hypothetical protein
LDDLGRPGCQGVLHPASRGDLPQAQDALAISNAINFLN